MGLKDLLTNPPQNFKYYVGGQGYTGNGSTPNMLNLKYGNDTLGGGDSNQPYIKAKIPVGFNNLQDANNDFILRGGILAVRDSAVDVVRLGKMFIDTKSPSGLLFIAKQNLLSRIAVRTQTSGRTLNEGVYSPLNTLAEAGIVAFGGHLVKQGINPFASTGAYSNNNNLYAVRVKYFQPASENRLALLANATKVQKINPNPISLNGFKLNDGINVMTYPGGPGAPLGIGRTGIRYASPEQLTGLSNIKNSKGYFYGPFTWTPKQNSTPLVDPLGNFIINQKGPVYNVYNPTTGSLSPLKSLDSLKTNTTPNPEGKVAFTSNGTDVQTQENLNTSSNLNKDRNSSYFTPSIQDFREVLRTKLKEKGPKFPTGPNAGKPWTTVLSNAPNYQNQNLETRTNIGGRGGLGPGNLNKTLISYTSGSGIGPVDKINALPIYRSEYVNTNQPVNDLVKFRIAAIDTQNPTLKNFIHFRAFLDSFSDTYNADWGTVNYLGRGEDFYTYKGFNRGIAMGWTVAAQSKEEIMIMYKKLNYLASTLAPSYTSKGYMAGNLVQLTVGGYLYEQVGFISGLTYDVPMESPWEIGINDEGDSDSSVKEVPHIIKVTGFNFIPIQSFIPSKQKLYGFNKEGKGFATAYGSQRFISLATAGQNARQYNNYDTPDPNKLGIK
jgi:hypothetical protein